MKEVYLPKEQFSDHDLLITLNAKFDNLSIDVKTMGDGLSSRVNVLELWKEQIDIYHAKIPLEKYGKLAESYERLQSNFKLIAIVGTPILAILVALISEAIRHFFGF